MKVNKSVKNACCLDIEKYGASMINLTTDSYIDSRRMQFHYLL